MGQSCSAGEAGRVVREAGRVVREASGSAMLPSPLLVVITAHSPSDFPKPLPLSLIATPGSAVRWGMAAWPPRPRSVASNWMAPAAAVGQGKQPCRQDEGA